MRAPLAHHHRQRCAPALTLRTLLQSQIASKSEIGCDELTVPFEVLHRPLVFLCLGARFKGAEISATSRLRISFS
jgi:hypothetical protein